MSATGRAVRIVSGPRYRLVATLAGGAEESARDEFDSLPAAQSGVSAFVCAVAERGRPTSIRVERLMPTGGNGKAPHAPIATEALRRWNETVIDRILGQRSARVGPEISAAELRAAPPIASVATAEPPPETPERTIDEAHIPPEPDTAAHSASDDALPDVATAEVPQSIDAAPRVDETGAETPIDSPPVLDQVESTPRPEEFVAFAADVPDATASPAPAPAPADTPASAHAAYRPRHRRTRWALILTAAFVAMLVIGMILLETNGDPIGYLRKLGDGENMRETLPFRNGDGVATKPAGQGQK
jgi:hypothetical protein